MGDATTPLSCTPCGALSRRWAPTHPPARLWMTSAAYYRAQSLDRPTCDTTPPTLHTPSQRTWGLPSHNPHLHRPYYLSINNRYVDEANPPHIRTPHPVADGHESSLNPQCGPSTLRGDALSRRLRSGAACHRYRGWAARWSGGMIPAKRAVPNEGIEVRATRRVSMTTSAHVVMYRGHEYLIVESSRGSTAAVTRLDSSSVESGEEP